LVDVGLFAAFGIDPFVVEVGSQVGVAGVGVGQQLLITDKGFASKPFEQSLSEQGVTLLRPSRKEENLRAGEPMLKKVRQLIESVNDTLKGQLDLEQHGGSRWCRAACWRCRWCPTAKGPARWPTGHTTAMIDAAAPARAHLRWGHPAGVAVPAADRDLQTRMGPARRCSRCRPWAPSRIANTSGRRLSRARRQISTLVATGH
jgi:hypothetical protein